jgi:hypothetical protein
MQYSLTHRQHGFGGACCLQLQGKRELTYHKDDSSSYVTLQKTRILILTAVITSIFKHTILVCNMFEICKVLAA